MKAVVYHRYGSPDVFHVEDIPVPTPKEGEVLVKIRAASVNSWDADLMAGVPRVLRMPFSFRTPKYPVLGADIAGVVEAVGPDTERFNVGDEVFGDLCASNWGGFAEYTCAKEEALALKPPGMSFDEAASLPQAGVLALQALRKGKTAAGESVLMNGAGGGVGTLLIQMAKSSGCEVTGVDSAAKLDLLRSVGADHVIDYAREDYTKTGRQYDLIVEVVADKPLAVYRDALKPGGRFVIVGGRMWTIMKTIFLGSYFSRKWERELGLLMHAPDAEDVATLGHMVEEGTIKPVIDRRYPLEGVADAMRYFQSGQVQGKIVITMES